MDWEDEKMLELTENQTQNFFPLETSMLSANHYTNWLVIVYEEIFI